MKTKRRPQTVDASPQQDARAVQSPYLTSHEALVYLRLDDLASPLSALYRLIKEHHLPHGRRGGLYLFDRRDLDAWIKGFGSAIDMVRARRSA
jgi:excisionase family DNA binding protein